MAGWLPPPEEVVLVELTHCGNKMVAKALWYNMGPEDQNLSMTTQGR